MQLQEGNEDAAAAVADLRHRPDNVDQYFYKCEWRAHMKHFFSKCQLVEKLMPEEDMKVIMLPSSLLGFEY